MASAAEKAVRDYLVSLRDPASLRDDERVQSLQSRLEEADDELARLQIRQEMIEAEQPPVQKFEDEFVTHAKAWAEQTGVSDRAFLAEGVPAAVLRKAGFRNVGSGRRRGGGAAAASSGGGRRRRVSADEVRSAIPSKGNFTVKDVQDASGASNAVVRRVIGEEVEAGSVQDLGPDPEHTGRGRAPTVYQR